ncbi:Casein kinase I isoform gamma-1 [Halotydeus destructor]|nr:Casein kinase I isoform gamma-1 [Halotydeus destructor]
MGLSDGIVLVASKYKVGKVLGTGSFGELCRGKNIETGEEVAIKFESVEHPAQTLQFEYSFYKKLGNSTRGVPKLYAFSDVPNKECHVLVMEILGESLEGLFNKCERHFSLKTVLQIAGQLISRIESVHEKGILHRDIKPDNFLLGKKGGKNEKIIHVIDFGLAKEYLDDKGRHIPMKDGVMCLGTQRYMSVNAHKLQTQSRRDDLEAIGYVLLYLLLGQLPWQGLDLATQEERSKEIGRLKDKMSPKVLCEEAPKSFELYMTYAKNLEFSETPDYNYLRELFKREFRKKDFEKDDTYDWDTKLDQEVKSLRKIREIKSNAKIERKKEDDE